MEPAQHRPNPRGTAALLAEQVRHALNAELIAGRRLRLGLAFSGGPDSTVLAWAIRQISQVEVVALHIDHGMDAGSAERAQAARRLAGTLGLEWRDTRICVRSRALPGESLEEAARRLRYQALRNWQQALELDVIATAHHADDQAETVALRVYSGSGLRGLAGISPRLGSFIRPLLGARRSDIEATVAMLGLEAIIDPTNLDTGPLRNRFRHHILGELARSGEDPQPHLIALADASRAAFPKIDQRLRRLLAVHAVPGGAALDLASWLDMPAILQDHALELLHRVAGQRYPPTSGAVRELRRQLASGGAACDCGGGLRWRTSGGMLQVEPASPRVGTKIPDFTYTVKIPGVFFISEISASLRIEKSDYEPWMAMPFGQKAAFSLPPNAARLLEIRNRRPGDRVVLPGTSTSRRLNRLFAQFGVSNHHRQHLPLLCSRNKIVWIPGMTVDSQFTARPDRSVWLAELSRPDITEGISNSAARLHLSGAADRLS